MPQQLDNIKAMLAKRGFSDVELRVVAAEVTENGALVQTLELTARRTVTLPKAKWGTKKLRKSKPEIAAAVDELLVEVG